jgi:hypothetical protein
LFTPLIARRTAEVPGAVTFVQRFDGGSLAANSDDASARFAAATFDHNTIRRSHYHRW